MYNNSFAIFKRGQKTIVDFKFGQTADDNLFSIV